MNKEAYVSFETAKLLKEKGFDWPTIEYYSSSGGIYRFADGIADICGILSYPRPTQQMACRWLREVHNIHIGVFVDDVDKYVAFLDEIPATGHTSTPIEGFYNSYEDSVEAALEYVLKNLI